MMGFVSILDYGAAGDGEADDSSAIAAALKTGQPVYIPATRKFYKISVTLGLKTEGQRMFGDGYLSQIRQTSRGVGCVSLLADHCSVSNVHFFMNGETTKDTGVTVVRKSHCTIEQCTFSNALGSGVTLFTADSCSVIDNVFPASPACAGRNLVAHTELGADISVTYGSSRNVVRGNRMSSSNGIAIRLLSLTESHQTDANVITGNSVQNYKTYGIIAYRVGEDCTPGTPRLWGNVISNNTVLDISGTTRNLHDNSYSFGCGIYIQGAENTSVVGNTVRNTHCGDVAFTRLLAPGGIGCANVSQFSIVGNTITGDKMCGVVCGDAHMAGANAGGGGIIANNVISDTHHEGILLTKQANVIIDGNMLEKTSGIRVANDEKVGPNSNVSISKNTIKNCLEKTVAAIYIHATEKLAINGNTIDACPVHGIYIGQHCADVSVVANNVFNHQVRGIQVGAGVFLCSLYNNRVTGAEKGSLVGYQIDSKVEMAHNQVRACQHAIVGVAPSASCDAYSMALK